MISSPENFGPDRPELPKRKLNPLKAAKDSSNIFAVGASRFEMLRVTELAIHKPVMGRISRDEALNLAAWIVALADPNLEEFAKILQQIKNK